MEPIAKIKALQEMAGIEADGVASSTTWLHIYYLLFNSVPYDLNVDSLIKAIQQKIHVRADGYPWVKTWDALYDLLIEGEFELEDSDIVMDPINEQMLTKLTAEVIPFAKELIRLSAKKGIHVRLLDKFTDSNFGLSFYVGIYEKNEDNELVYVDKSIHYNKVARLGEFIGLTYNYNEKIFNSLPRFEVVPAWAVRMSEGEMVQELNRRKLQNLKLLSIF